MDSKITFTITKKPSFHGAANYFHDYSVTQGQFNRKTLPINILSGTNVSNTEDTMDEGTKRP